MGGYSVAKVLIGNVKGDKGKDGRGITKIVKTASTGAVDTYTITYTDSTTSTFTVNNSDNIALQRQIVPSAAVESSATASQAYAAGDYVVVNGLLRKATAAIAKGNAISDSNSTATTVAGELANSVPRIVERGKSGIWTYVKYADGTAECHGTTKHKVPKTGTQWLSDVQLPFTMVKPANSYDDFAIFVSGGAYTAPVLYPDVPYEKASVSVVTCGVFGATETDDIPVSYLVLGRWK